MALHGNQVIVGGGNTKVVYLFDTGAVDLEVGPDVVTAGDTLTFDVSRGLAGGFLVFAVVTIDAADVFAPLTYGSLSGAGEWQRQYTVPANLPASTLGFRSYALDPCSFAARSVVKEVTFQ